jgi:hypothetical protein
MAERHVVGALRNKRAELAGTVSQLERQLAQQRANLTHLDATRAARSLTAHHESAYYWQGFDASGDCRTHFFR